MTTADDAALVPSGLGPPARTAIVVPCYNEAKRLDRARFEAFLRDDARTRFLFVNDGSTDGTLELLGQIREAEPGRVAVLDLAKNVGKAEAVRRGMLRAADDGADYAGYWDADLATPLEAIPDFCAILDARPELEMVFGARVKLLGRAITRRAPRHYLGRLFATTASTTLGLAIYDTQCGAKLFRATPEVMSLFAEPFATRWIFDVELIARLVRARRGHPLPQPERVIYELPLMAWRDVAGSKLRPGDFVKAFFELLTIRRKYLRSVGRGGPVGIAAGRDAT